MFNDYDDIWTARAKRRKRGKSRRKGKCNNNCGCKDTPTPIEIIPPLPPPVTTDFRSYTWVPKFSFPDDKYSSSPGGIASTKLFNTVDVKKGFRCPLFSPILVNSQLLINDWKTTPRVLTDDETTRKHWNIACDPPDPYDLNQFEPTFPLANPNGVYTQALKYEYRNLHASEYEGYDTLNKQNGFDGTPGGNWSAWKEPTIINLADAVNTFNAVPDGEMILFYTPGSSIVAGADSESIFIDVPIGSQPLQAYRWGNPYVYFWKPDVESPIDGFVFQIRMSGHYSLDDTGPLIGSGDTQIEHFQNVDFTFGEEGNDDTYQYMTVFVNFVAYPGATRIKTYNTQSNVTAINKVVLTRDAQANFPGTLTTNPAWLWPKVWVTAAGNSAKSNAVPFWQPQMLSTKLTDGQTNPLDNSVDTSALTRYLLTIGSNNRQSPEFFDAFNSGTVKVVSNNSAKPLSFDNNPNDDTWRIPFEALNTHPSALYIKGDDTPRNPFRFWCYTTSIGAVPGDVDYTQTVWLKNQTNGDLYLTNVKLNNTWYPGFLEGDIQQIDDIVDWLAPLNISLTTSEFITQVIGNLGIPSLTNPSAWERTKTLSVIPNEHEANMAAFLNHDSLPTTGEASLNTMKSGMFIKDTWENIYTQFLGVTNGLNWSPSDWLATMEGDTKKHFEFVTIVQGHYVTPSGTPIFSHDVLIMKSSRYDNFDGNPLPPNPVDVPPPVPIEGVQVRTTPRPSYTCINQVQAGTTTLPNGPAALPGTLSTATGLPPICPDLPTTGSRMLMNLVNRAEVRVEYLGSNVIKRPFRMPFLHTANANFVVSGTDTRDLKGVNPTGTSVQLMGYNSCSRFANKGNLSYFQNRNEPQVFNLAYTDTTAGNAFTNTLSYAQGTWPGAIFNDGRFHNIANIRTTLPANTEIGLLGPANIYLYNPDGTRRSIATENGGTIFTAANGGPRYNALFAPFKYKIYAKFPDLYQFDHGRSICFLFRCGKIKLTNIETNDPWIYEYDAIETDPNAALMFANMGTIPLSQFSKDDNSVSFYIEPGDWGAVVWGFKYLKQI